jgi:L-rhamnose mutarotase
MTVGDQQIALRMQLRPGCEAEYERRHDEIWPDLKRALLDAGIHDYSIFLDEETLALFAVLRLGEADHLDTLAIEPVVQRWWEYMADLMIVHPGGRPVEWPLRRVFRLDPELG